MSSVDIIFYREGEDIPGKEFLDSLPKKSSAKGIRLLEELSRKGHELRRPHADVLKDGIYELRWRDVKVQCRMLYFFHGQGIVVVSHGIQKKSDAVPEIEIERAIRRKGIFHKDPEAHSWVFKLEA